MKVSELTGAQLDYWVAQAERTIGCLVTMKDGACYVDSGPGPRLYHPSMHWAQGGPLIERERMTLWHRIEDGSGNDWNACVELRSGHEVTEIGTTPLQAAMRAYVASKYGKDVPDA